MSFCKPSVGLCALAFSFFGCVVKYHNGYMIGVGDALTLIGQAFFLMCLITIAGHLYSRMKAFIFLSRPKEPKVPRDAEIIVLPEEPPVDAEGVVNVVLRCPSGRILKRRFLKSHPSSVLVDWVRNSGYHPAIYAILEPYPRRPLITEAHLTLESIGIIQSSSFNVEEKVPRLDYVKEFVIVT